MRQASKAPPTGFPEYAVRRETISGFFDPPLARSTFHDFVNKGIILPIKGIRGFYRLNDSLRRLGLREVPKIPKEDSRRSQEDVLRLAFTLIDAVLFPVPGWLMREGEVEFREEEHARLLADLYRPEMESLGSYQEKLALAAGLLDAYSDLAELWNGAI